MHNLILVAHRRRFFPSLFLVEDDLGVVFAASSGDNFMDFSVFKKTMPPRVFNYVALYSVRAPLQE